MSSMVRVACPSKEGASAVSFMGNVVNLRNENILKSNVSSFELLYLYCVGRWMKNIFIKT